MISKITKKLYVFSLALTLALVFGFSQQAAADDWLQPADWEDTAHVFKRNVVTPGSPPLCRFELDDFEVPADTYEIIGISFWMNKTFGCHFPTFFMDTDENGEPDAIIADRTNWGNFQITDEGTDPNGNPVCRYEYDFADGGQAPVNVLPGETYWIALSSPPCPGHYDWGLHNTPLANAWGSNARWCPEGTGVTPTPPYTNLDYPVGHAWNGQQVDVAFEIRFAGPVVPLDADFSGEPRTGVAPHNVNFTSEVTGGVEPYDYAWDLDGDGDFDDAFIANPAYTYVDTGRYDVSLRVTDDAATVITVTEERYIQANEAGTQSGCISIENPETVWFLCGDFVTESCQLQEDMECPTGHGLIIDADNVTIYGNSYKIDGDDPGACTESDLRSGIKNLAKDNVTIENLKVTNFCNGIWLEGIGEMEPCSHNVIECCSIYDNGSDTGLGRGIVLESVENSTISRNRIYNQRGDFDFRPPVGTGIYLCLGDNNVFAENTIYNCATTGIFLRGGPENTQVHDNFVFGNDFGGIRLQCVATALSTVEYNYSTGNEGPGIFIGGPENTIQYNTSTNNVDGQGSGGGVPNNGWGIVLARSGHSNTVSFNTACGNDYADIADIYSGPAPPSSGVSNTCDHTQDWSDDDAKQQDSCRYNCSTVVDSDGDGVRDYAYPGSGTRIDNCCLTPNPDQRDTDGDGYGNICDCDLNNNGWVGGGDFAIFAGEWGQQGLCLDSDFNGDGVVGMSDFAIFGSRWGTYAPFDYCPPEGVTSYLTVNEDYTCWGAGHLHPMIEQIDEYVCEQGIPACAPIGPNCLPEEVAEQLVEESPAEAWYITDEPVGVIVPCP